MTDFVSVPQEVFYATMGPLDVHPSVANPDVTIWEMRSTREVVGKSLPGWRNGGNPNNKKTYFLTKKRADFMTAAKTKEA